MERYKKVNKKLFQLNGKERAKIGDLAKILVSLSSPEEACQGDVSFKRFGDHLGLATHAYKGGIIKPELLQSYTYFLITFTNQINFGCLSCIFNCLDSSVGALVWHFVRAANLP